MAMAGGLRAVLGAAPRSALKRTLKLQFQSPLLASAMVVAAPSAMVATTAKCSVADVEAPRLAVAPPTPVPWRITRGALVPEKRWWLRLVRALKRAGYLLLVGAPLLVLVPIARYSEDKDGSKQNRLFSYLEYLIEQGGPTFIKLAQWASTREDLFPVAFTSKFARLQDRNHPHAWHHTQKVLERSFGKDWREKLPDLEREAIGSGCIAQVYRGQYHDPETGEVRPVAVKVLHPAVLEQVEADMDILRILGAWIDNLPRAKYLSVPSLIEEFHDLLTEQLDMRVERENLDKLRKHFQYNKDVCFPEPYEATQEALIMTYIEGVPIRRYVRDANNALDEGDAAEQETRLKLSKIGMDTVFNMVFMNNFVHADLHPGNLLVTSTGDHTQIAILDAGMAVELTDTAHAEMLDILLAFFQSKGYRAGELMVAGAPDEVSDAEAFCQGIAKLVDKSHSSPFFEQFGTYVTEICGMACTHRVKLNEHFVTMAMAIKVLEGLALSLNPEISLCDSAIPILLRAQQKRVAKMVGFRS